MTQVTVRPGERIQELAPDVSSVIIEEAIAERAPLRITPEDTGVRLEIAGRIVDGDDTVLNVALESPNSSASVLFAASSLKACIIVSGQSYVFPARCIRPVSSAEDQVIYLVRPETVSVVRRRKSRRYRFHSPAQVDVFIDNDEGKEYFTATMMNLSAHGVACRIREDVAALTGIDRILRIRLRVGSTPEALDMKCRVSNITQAGTEGEVVLGLEFVVDEETATAWETLQELLRSPTELEAG